MIIRSQIPYPPQAGFFSRAISPLVMIKEFIDDIYQKLLSMIWDELLENKAHQFSGQTHLVAFLLLSIFSMIFYNLEYLEDIVLLVFFLLWIADYYLAKKSFKNCKYEHILLDAKNSDVVLTSLLPGNKAAREHFKQTDINGIFLAPEVYKGGAFRVVQARAWRIYIIHRNLDGSLVLEEENFSKAFRKASDLADFFKVSLEIGNSAGSGDYVVEKIAHIKNQVNFDNIWRSTRTSISVHIHKNFSLALLRKIIKSVLEETGVFLFMVIMAAVMVRFGMLLTFLIGPKIGLEPPTLVLSISFSGVLSFFAPQLDFMSLVALIFPVFMLVCSGFQHFREQRIIIDREWIQYHVNGEPLAQIATEVIRHLVLLKEPEPTLLLIGCSDECLKIDRFEDYEDGEELYFHISKQLEYYQNQAGITEKEIEEIGK